MGKSLCVAYKRIYKDLRIHIGLYILSVKVILTKEYREFCRRLSPSYFPPSYFPPLIVQAMLSLLCFTSHLKHFLNHNFLWVLLLLTFYRKAIAFRCLS